MADDNNNNNTRADIAEDLRRVGVAFIVAGLVAAVIKSQIGPGLAVAITGVGVVICSAGYVIAAIQRRR